MKVYIKNVRVYASSARECGGISIHIDFSGQRRYLTFYRYNPRLYALLKPGISLDELRRCTDYKTKSHSEHAMIHSIRQLLRIIDDYIEYDYLPEQMAG